MATWYVDPERGATTNSGTEASPWLLIPGQTGASSQTAYSVSNNDTIKVRTGTVSKAGQVNVPNSGLTYTGYGMANNVLVLTLPDKDVTKTRQVPVVKEPGVTEGMWVLDMTGYNETGISIPAARANTTVEDFHVKGEGWCSNGVAAGNTASTDANAIVTLRRFLIEGIIEFATSNASGVVVLKHNCLVEYGKIRRTQNDNIRITANASNLYKAGSYDILRYLDLEEPNTAMDGSHFGDFGDSIQLVHNAGRFEGRVLMHDIYAKKRDPYKQFMLVQDCTGGVILRRFHVDATNPNPGDIPQCGVFIGCMVGALTIEDGYFGGDCDQHTFRLRAGATALAKLMATGSSITIRNIVATGSSRHNFFDMNEDQEVSALEVDGAVVIEGCTSSSVNAVPTASFQGAIYIDGTDVTFGVNFNATIRNNVFAMPGRQVQLETGKAGDALYKFQNNFWAAGSYFIGATEYTSLALFEAAHSAATTNSTADPLLSETLRPTVGSPVLGAGLHTTYKRDVMGYQRARPPAIGAFDAATLRRELDTDPATW